MKIVAVTIVLMQLGISALAQREYMPQSDQVIVRYCDLIKKPEQYDHKEVMVRATYRYGFEQSELYCLGCAGYANTWVEFDSSFKKHTKSKYRRMVKANGFRGRTVNIEAVGIFYAHGGFGDGSYSTKFVINKLKRAEIIADNGLLPNALPEKTRARVCGD